MIDTHCHILPGIDDGSQHLAESIKMAEIAAADGISTIVATPHIKTTLHSQSLIKTHVNELNEQLVSRDIPVRILPGAEVNYVLDPSLLGPYTVNSTNYILIEFPHSHLPGNAREIIFRLLINGFVPIIAHPERNPSVLQHPDKFIDLLDPNLLVQITGASICGVFGRKIKECAAYLLSKGVVDIIATDAHSAVYRQPVLSEAVQEAGGIVGADAAELLVSANPQAVISGEILAR